MTDNSIYSTLFLKIYIKLMCLYTRMQSIDTDGLLMMCMCVCVMQFSSFLRFILWMSRSDCDCEQKIKFIHMCNAQLLQLQIKSAHTTHMMMMNGSLALYYDHITWTKKNLNSYEKNSLYFFTEGYSRWKMMNKSSVKSKK